MDDYRELRRRERAQDALRRIHEKGTSWTGTGEPTKRTRTSQRTGSSSSCNASDTFDPMASNTSETGAGPSAATTEQ